MVHLRSALILTVCLAASGVSAQAIGDPGLSGEYRLVDSESLTKIPGAIQRGTAKMNAFIRGMARRRLRRGTKPYEWIRFDRVGEQLAVWMQGFGQWPAVEAWTSGRGVLGERVKVSHQMRTNGLVQTIRTKRGVRTHTFTWSTDKRVVNLHVRINSKHLTLPIEYELTYRRRS